MGLTTSILLTIFENSERKSEVYLNLLSGTACFLAAHAWSEQGSTTRK